MFAIELRAAVEAAPRERLCDLSKALWQAFGAGAVSEAEAGELSALIEARRAVGTSFSLGTRSVAPPAAGEGGLAVAKMARAILRKPQRPPVRSVAIERRRRLAASGPMPPALACRFTTGQLAALKIISDDVRDSGTCMAPIDAIAARAGVCRTVVQNAIREACRLGMLQRQERRRTGANSLPSILRVIDREWLQWLARGPKGGGLTGSSTMGKRIIREDEANSDAPFRTPMRRAIPGAIKPGAKPKCRQAIQNTAPKDSTRARNS